jgi:hypothetical protein
VGWRVCATVFSTALCAGCAHGTPPQVLGAAAFSNIEYPHTIGEKCDDHGQKATVTVHVTEGTGLDVPGAAVYLIDADGSGRATPTGWQVKATDQSGQASIVFERWARYFVVVQLTGFMPEMRALESRPGCVGTLPVRLRVATTEYLQRLNAGRGAEK